MNGDRESLLPVFFDCFRGGISVAFLDHWKRQSGMRIRIRNSQDPLADIIRIVDWGIHIHMLMP